MIDEKALIARHIEPNHHRPGLDEARLREHGVSVWALIGYWMGYNGDVDHVVRDFMVPREAVEAAIAYYRRHKGLIDARIAANSDAVA